MMDSYPWLTTLGGSTATLLTLGLWFGLVCVLISPHLSIVIGSWILSHGTNLARFRRERQRQADSYSRLAESISEDALLPGRVDADAGVTNHER